MILASDALFTIGDFEVTATILALGIFAVVLLIAIIAYRVNHRIQQKAAKYMDDECLIYSQKGLEKFLKKKGKKLSNPTIVVVEFKNLNYLYTNYDKRNKLMLQIADELLKGLDKNEVAGRMEFNKFPIIFEGKNRDEIFDKCVSIEKKFEDISVAGYGKYDFDIAFGIYENPPVKEDDVVMVAAAIIKYSNISNGNKYYFCLEVKEALDRLKRMNLEKDYDFEQKRFIPYIQPKVDLKTGRVVGGEILVRWIDENHNFKYSPAEFIPLFESNGFIKKVDDLMFQHACLLAQTLAEKGRNDVVISVNSSKMNFLSSNYEQKIMETVSYYHVSPKNLEIEVTETTVMENFQYVSNCIMTLRQLGFSVAMDDFGQEYSSLGSLSVNPFDTIKLDRVFFNNKLSTEKDRHIVRNVLDMLSKLNYKKVCEGVSDKQTLDVLATINQDVIIQGYCISAPIPLPQFEAFLDTVFEFNYPPLVPYNDTLSSAATVIPQVEVKSDAGQGGTGAGNTSINITGLGGGGSDNAAQFEEMRRQMMEMERKFQAQLEEQRRLSQEEEMKRLRAEMEKLKDKPSTKQENNGEIESLRREVDMLRAMQTNQPQQQGQTYQKDYGRDDEITRLRRELDDLRYQQDRDRRYANDVYDRERYSRYEDRYSNNNNSEIAELQRQVRELTERQNQQPQIDVNELISRLSQTQNDNAKYQVEKAQEEARSLRDKLERERKEREELENLLRDLQTQDEETEEDEQLAQEQADLNLNLDLSTLKDDESVDDDEEDEDDEEEETSVVNDKVVKPNLSLGEIEAIIKSYQDKYSDDWNQRAKEELKDGYYEVINGLKYYKGRQKRTFIDKIKKASPELKQIFNIVKNEFMKYSGVTNKLTNSYDCFYLGRKQVAKLSLTSKKVKVYLAADPNKYPERQFPHKDLSSKKSQVRTPYYTLVKSQLSVKRINKVYADVMAENNISVNPDYKPIDYATKYKFLKVEK